MHKIIHIEPDAPAKPAWGESCNGCGVCCLVEPCPVGMWVSRKLKGACTALVWSEAQKRYLCGVVCSPEKFMQPRWMVFFSRLFARRWIAAGKGCDCDYEGS